MFRVTKRYICKLVMKKLIIVFLSALVFFSCETDFDVASDWKEILIVYGLLEPNETDHYIRIQKAFLDEETGALEIAPISDSIYSQDSLVVTMRDVENDITYTLQKIQSPVSGIVKDPGIFGTTPHVLFTFNATLTPGNTYELTATNVRTKLVITSKTKVLGSDFIFRYPGLLTKLNNNTDFRELRFDYNDPNAEFSVDFKPVANAFVYQLDATLHMDNYQRTGGVWNKTGEEKIDWNIFKNTFRKDFSTATGNFISNDYLRIAFFDNLNVKLTGVPTSTGTHRKMEFISFEMTAAGEELQNYIDINTDNFDITEGFSKPVYTNIDNGIGVFSSRITVPITYDHSTAPFNAENLFVIENITQDSLHCNFLTKDLNFLCAANEPCFCQ